jgi:hypothetical protein
MSDLIDEVVRSFNQTREDHGDRGPVTVLGPGDSDELGFPPGFNAMRDYYGDRLVAITRRGYRHFAGSTMPTNADQLMELTSKVMAEYLLALVLETFTDGVAIGHQQDQAVRIFTHFNKVDDLFTEEPFRESSRAMAKGFAEDPSVLAYFNEYIEGGVHHLSHITGFVHRDIEPGKIWDLWLLIGTACMCASYLAGHHLGTTWRERDVLDGIELATQGDDG